VEEGDTVDADGPSVYATRTVMTSEADRRALAEDVLSVARSLLL
jgi:hypothetical protein